MVWNMHNNTNSTDISQFSTHLGWRPLCKLLPYFVLRLGLWKTYPAFCNFERFFITFLELDKLATENRLKIRIHKERHPTSLRRTWSTRCWQSFTGDQDGVDCWNDLLLHVYYVCISQRYLRASLYHPTHAWTTNRAIDGSSGMPWSVKRTGVWKSRETIMTSQLGRPITQYRQVQPTKECMKWGMGECALLTAEWLGNVAPY